MNTELIHDFFSGFIRIHILTHTALRPYYGQELKEELETHGYHISYGSLYPLLAQLQKKGLLNREDVNVGGKIRKYYRITPEGTDVLNESRHKLRELTRELLIDNNRGDQR